MHVTLKETECADHGVCQPSVPVLAATAVMEKDGDPCTPR
jgi:poly-beta-hydroxyalkanoate depolymerase